MHKPVLLNQVLDILKPKDGCMYIDATFGCGGYTKAILKSANCVVHAIDQDPDAITYFDEIKKDFLDRVFLYTENFADALNSKFKNIKIDGVVFDVGTCATQLQDASRGFSFAKEGPLDMRMNKKASIDAHMIVNSFAQDKIADIIYNLGGERNSRKIAKAIVAARQKSPIKTTTQLASIVQSCFFKKYYRIDPATRTFQALRIFVNDELEALQKGLKSALDLVARGGKVIVVSFHSLEDKIAKEIFRSLAGDKFAVINKKVIRPIKQEELENPRSRSAKLRAVQRL